MALVSNLEENIDFILKRGGKNDTGNMTRHPNLQRAYLLRYTFLSDD